MKSCKTLLFLLLAFILFQFCNSPPAGFERNNPYDFESESLDLSLLSDLDFKVQVVDFNSVNISWPYIPELKELQLLRVSYTNEEQEIIFENTIDTDTTFTDSIQNSGNYFYRLNFITSKDDQISFESDTILSNWIEGPVLEYNDDEYRISGSQTFAMRTEDNKALIQFNESFNYSPILTEIDLENEVWEIKPFINNLGSSHDFIRSNHFHKLNNDQFLVIAKFFRNQSFLGYTCNVNSENCTEIGPGNLSNNANLTNTSFSTLNDGRVIFTGWRGSSFARIFNPSDNSVTNISSPRDNKIISTLTTLENGNVIGCESNQGEEVGNTCQIFNVSTGIWSYINPHPLNQYEINSILMKDGKVFFIDRWDGSTNQAQIYDPIANNWFLTSNTKFSTNRFFYYSFIRPFQILESGKISVITNQQTNLKIEIYDSNSDSWIKTYHLPDHVSVLYNMIELTSDKFLVTYAAEEFPLVPKSAMIKIQD